MSGANPVRKCPRCPTMHTRKHTYCRPCYLEWRRKWRVYTGSRCAPGTPPPPPEGFNLRDKANGRPYGSIHGRESDWRDGPRPAGDRVNDGLAGWY
jgi:hypothetical protein